MLNIETTIERIHEIIESENFTQLQEELNNFHSADLAEILPELNTEERLVSFENIEEDKAAEMLEYLTPQYQVELLSEIDEEKASRIIFLMPHDSAADILGDMEEDESESYLNKLPNKFSDEIRELLTYKEDTAGGLMNSTVLTVRKEMSIEEVLNYIRKEAEEDTMELYYIYVVDKHSHLLGVVSLRDLLTSHAKIKIEEIMMSDIVKLHVDDKQDHVAEIFMKYQYNALPVVDLYNRLKGIVTWDDVSDIVEEETTEEILQSSGITTAVVDEDEILSGNIFNAIRARAPWLFITLIGEFIAVNVADKFEFAIHALPVVAIFMPLLAGLGGNIGTQSITLMVRGLSTGQVTMNSALHHIFREMLVGLMIGLVFGVLVTICTWGWQHHIQLGIVVGFAMVVNMTLATIIGTVAPFLLKAMKIDPAVASGPVIATTIDVIGLAIYFSMVSIFLLGVLN